MTPSALIGHICYPNAIWIVTVMCNTIADMRSLVMSGVFYIGVGDRFDGDKVNVSSGRNLP